MKLPILLLLAGASNAQTANATSNATAAPAWTAFKTDPQTFNVADPKNTDASTLMGTISLWLQGDRKQDGAKWVVNNTKLVGQYVATGSNLNASNTAILGVSGWDTKTITVETGILGNTTANKNIIDVCKLVIKYVAATGLGA